MSGFSEAWQSYNGLDVDGVAPPQEVAYLRKALFAGNAINNPGASAGEGFPIRVEALDRTLKNTTYSLDHIEFWKRIPRKGATNTVQEYNQIQEYGALDQDAFIPEGGLPEETDSTYERKYTQIKYLGTQRRVSHVMTMTTPAHGNQIALETINGTKYILRRMEKNLFNARSDLDSIQFDGLEKLIEDGAPATHILDLRGGTLNEDVLHDAALTVFDAPSYGQGTHLFMNPKTHADLTKAFFPRARFDQFNKTDEGFVGLDVKGYTSPAGKVQFVPDVFLDDGGSSAGVSATGDASKRPGTPTISTALAAAGSGSSQFATADAGTYNYSIVAVNRYGNSVAVDVGSVAVAAADGVTFGVSPAVGAPNPSYYKVYRTVKGGAAGTERLILRVPNTVAAAETTITDLNANLPGTTKAFLFQMDETNMAFRQLAPMVKVPLALIDTSIRWMQLLYGAPELYTPRHNVIIKNIGRTPGYVGAP